MGAVPKRKISKARGRRRRTHQTLKTPQTVKCPHCGEDKLPHRECSKCGGYRKPEAKT